MKAGSVSDGAWKRELEGRNLFDEILSLRDRQREVRQDELLLLKSEHVPIELNQWGMVQWYLHPLLDRPGNRALIAWVLHIPPGSRTGKLKCQGGHVYYVWSGSKGRTEIDGISYPWAEACVINLPMRGEGIVFQHFNDGEDTVKLIGVEENLVNMLTVDRGSGFEVLEPCPEWEAS